MEFLLQKKKINIVSLPILHIFVKKNKKKNLLEIDKDGEIPFFSKKGFNITAFDASKIIKRIN